MYKNRNRALIASFVVFALAPLCGCQSDAAKVDSAQAKAADDANGIAQKAGGDWEKLSPSEKQVFLKMQDGNEASAKELVHALSGKTYEGRYGKPGAEKMSKPGDPGTQSTPPPASPGPGAK